MCRSAHLRRGHRTVNRPPCYGGRLVCRTGGVAGGAWRHCALCVRDGLWLTAGWGWDVGLEVAVAMAVAVGVSSDWRRGRSRNRSKSLGVQCKGVVFSRFLFCAAGATPKNAFFEYRGGICSCTKPDSSEISFSGRPRPRPGPGSRVTPHPLACSTTPRSLTTMAQRKGVQKLSPHGNPILAAAKKVRIIWTSHCHARALNGLPLRLLY